MSIELSPASFTAFFEAMHGYVPFQWQADLAKRVLSGDGWPHAIDVPTGMGKTAVLDIAVYALASQAAMRATERTAPTRTLFIVDRRVIVDQAYDRAVRIAGKLANATDGVLHDVAAALRSIAPRGAQPLAAVRMRGGTTWGWRWLEAPSQPAIVVGTVDQMGSRLLFRGYGVGRHVRPIDAALCGTDCLVVLDEAHLSVPLVETAVTVARYDQAAARPVLPHRRPRPIVMSATLPDDLADVHRLDPAAETSATAQARLRVERLVVPIELESSARDPVSDLARAMTETAVGYLNDPAIERIAVVCNTVGLARAVHSALARAAADADLCLLTGRCRPIDRERIAAEWGEQLKATTDRPPRARPLVAVATQTIEVGADFDVDLLVTEASPLDSLLQRLGRLDRLGRLGTSAAVVLHHERRHGVDDPVYGGATDATWRWLQDLVPGRVPRVRAIDVASTTRSAPRTDLGPLALPSKLEHAERAAMIAEAPPAPVALGPTLAAWARTDPVPEPDQPVAPFLHGIGRDVAQVLVCWRAGLPRREDTAAREAWEEELSTVPVSSLESVEVPIWEVRRFLAGAPPRALPDLEGTAEDDDGLLDEVLPVEAWIKRDESVLRAAGARLRPGDTVVIRAEDGGHDEWGWTGSAGSPVVDIADACQRGPTLRLRPEVLAGTMGGNRDEWERRIRAATQPGADDGQTELKSEILLVIAAHHSDHESSVAGHVRAIASELAARPLVVPSRRRPGVAVARAIGPEGSQWFLVTARRRDRGGTITDRDGDEGEATSSAAPRRVTLAEHLADVGERAAGIAKQMGLPEDIVAALDLAGRAHDLGKADPRFQAMLHGGVRGALRAEAAGTPLAKSGMDPGDRLAFSRARDAAGWPRGMRHEALSALLLASKLDEEASIADGLDRDLVTHLVASHHGWGRPLLPAMTDSDPRAVQAFIPGVEHPAAIDPDGHLIDWEAPSRFERLGRCYGWWGLALLEATLRLADIACSEEYGKEAH